MKGAVAGVHVPEISNGDLELMHKQEVSKAAHKKLDRRVARTGRVIIVRDVRAKALKHEKTEVKSRRGLMRRHSRRSTRRNLTSLNAEKKLWKWCGMKGQ